jgi:hypothetical protein
MSNERVTRKSRTIAEFVAGIVEMIGKDIHDIQKSALVDTMISNSIVQGTSKAVSDLLATELANMLDTYFADICKVAQEEIGLPYHLTSRAWYKRGAKPPQSEAEAKQYVVVFGNGRTGKAAGVRFVTQDDEPDPMLLVALSKRMDVVDAAIKTHDERLKKDITAARLSVADSPELLAHVVA